MLYEKVVEQVKRSPNIKKIGMILVHIGIVRSTSRSGDNVDEVEVNFDEPKIELIRQEMLKRPGIYEVVVATNPGRLSVGEEIMAVAVGGDIRENVFPVLQEAVNRIKAEGSHKLEFKRG